MASGRQPSMTRTISGDRTTVREARMPGSSARSSRQKAESLFVANLKPFFDSIDP